MPTTYLSQTNRTNRFLGRCENCIRPIAVEDADTFRDVLVVSCPDCSTSGIKLERVFGTVEEMSCDARCESAIGRTCVCSCGGANHGGAFMRTGEALVSAILAYRSTTQRRQQAAQRRAANRREAQEAQQRLRLAAYQEANSEILSALEGYTGSNSFIISIRAQAIIQGQMLTERQISAVGTAIEREARINVQRAASTPCPVGNGITIEGLIVSVCEERTYYTYSGEIQTKMLVKCDGGFKVWVSAPRSLGRVDRGRKVRFVANVSRSRDDESFGFAKRPRSAVYVDESIATAEECEA